MNEKNNFLEKGKVMSYSKLDTSIARLRNIFILLKSEWFKLHSRIKRGSGLAPTKEPLWFKHMDPVFTETNAEIRLSSSAQETSFVQDDRGESEEDSDNNSIGEEESGEVAREQAMAHEDLAELEENPITEEAPGNKRKTVVAVHKKSKKIRSNKQALSEQAFFIESLSLTF